jgi:hypothetical protein
MRILDIAEQQLRAGIEEAHSHRKIDKTTSNA